MKGLELSRRYWEECGKEIFFSRFPEVMSRAAVGLCGSGSDCLGYDDDVSQDHDYAAGFMIWLTAEDYAEHGFALSEAYDRLPREFCGVKSEHRSRIGDGRYGVKTADSFFRPYTGSAGAPETWQQWMSLPSHALACAVSGQVFYDGAGEFTATREAIRAGMPEDVRLKKIAAKAALMAQSGQYNYARCLRHGEAGAARLALDEFVRQSLGMLFLLNRRHMPFYKWSFRAAKELPILGDAAEKLEDLLASPEEGEIERIAKSVIAELRRQHLTEGQESFLEPHAYRVMKRIQNSGIAALHVMEDGEWTGN